MTSSSIHGYYCINVGGSGAAYVSAVRRRGASMCPLSSDYIYIGNYRELCRLPAAAPAEESARRHSYQSVSNSSSSSVWFTMFTSADARVRAAHDCGGLAST